MKKRARVPTGRRSSRRAGHRVCVPSVFLRIEQPIPCGHSFLSTDRIAGASIMEGFAEAPFVRQRGHIRFQPGRNIGACPRAAGYAIATFYPRTDEHELQTIAQCVLLLHIVST